MALENFAANTLIIPMDTTYQDAGMFKAYGLVYELLDNGIPVKWAIQSGKLFDGTDFTASAIDFQTAAPIVNHNYTGGPFIIDSAYAAMAAPIITAWQALYPNVKVHIATAPFSADIASTMTRAPLIAVEENNSSIMFGYLNIAAIPDSLGNVWTNASPDVLDETDMGNGAFFGGPRPTPPAPDCRRIKYDIFLSPHTSDGTWQDPVRVYELDEYLRKGGFLHGTCHSTLSIENFAGPFLTQAGFPETDLNGGNNGTFTVDVPDFPSAQAVSTGQVQTLPGGSFGSIYHGTPGLIYNAETQILAHFIENNKQYDFMMAGPYKNGTGAGKIVYEGGHNYGPTEPYSNKDDNLYTRFVLDSIFFAITKPLVRLSYTTANPNNVLFQNVINTINFSIENNGSSNAINQSFSVTLAPGVTYNGDASIPPTSIVGQTLNWSNVTLGDVPPGVVLTFTADYQPAALGIVKIADFTTAFDDSWEESYSAVGCRSAEVEQFETANLNAVKIVDKTVAQEGDTLTYTVTITNNGTLPATNVIFTDPIPAGAIFIPGSVTVAVPPGAPVPNPGDPSVGIPLPDIQPAPAPGSTVVVTFQVLVGDNDPIIDIENQAFVDYSFTNQFGTFEATAESNIVITQVEVGELTAAKSADKTVATVGDTITYTVVVTNTGTVTANNVVFTDTPPAGTSFVPGSVTVEVPPGAPAPVPGDPSVGIPLGSIPVGDYVIVTFQVNVDFIPAPPTAINTAQLSFNYTIGNIQHMGFAISNPVITQLVTPELTVVKSADRTAVDLGETVIYTVTVTNTGDVTAEDVVLTDIVPAGMTFVPGSVVVTIPPAPPAPVPGADPNAGIPLGDLAPGASATVTFQATATSIPLPNPTTNIATAEGLFTIDPAEPPRLLDFGSNPVDVLIENATLTITKSVDKTFAEVGDVLTYTVAVNNTGTVTATNVIFTDTPSAGTTFVPGSVTVAYPPGAPAPVAGDPSIGIPLNNIPAGGSAIVTFQVTVDAIPVPNPAVNVGTIDADFLVDQNLIHKTFDTSPVETKVEVAELNVNKTVDKAFVEVCQNLTYTITITNTGTVAANNVVVTDAPPNGTSFVAGSVTVAIPPALPVPVPGADPSLGINVGTIPAGGSAIVTFIAHADFVPVPNPTSNIALVSGSFPVDPNNPVDKDFESNPADTQIEIARLDITKSTDLPIAKVGDIVTYTAVITNTGTVPANNVVFTDAPPAGTSFIPGSVTLAFPPGGSVPVAGDPSTGILLGNIPVGGSVIVTFQASVDSIPTPNPTINIAAVTGSFPVDPNNPTGKTFESNPVPVQVELVELEVVKSVDKPYAEIGETVNYTVAITNTGTIIATNVVFTDNPPTGTTFVPGSITVAVPPGAPVPVAGNPSAGIPIPNIPAGGTVIVTFQVTVTSVPTPNPSENIAIVDALFPVDPTKPPVEEEFPSNLVDQNIINADIEVVKSVNKDAAVVGETLTYTVTVTNTGNVDVDAVMFDLVPAGTVFVPGSVIIATPPAAPVPVPGANPNIGVDLGTLTPGQSTIITFDVTIVSMPEPPIAINMATVEFQYIVNPAEPPRSKSEDSNEVETRIEVIEIILVKTADKDKVVQGDMLTYTVVVTNTGTLPVNNVIFRDPIPAGTSFVPESVTVAVPPAAPVPVPGANPEIGFNLGTINPGQSVIVTFSVRYDFLPCPPIIRNIAFVEFNYRIATSGPIEVGKAESNETETEAAQTNFKQLSVDEVVCIPSQKPDAEDIINILVDVEIIATRVIKTTKGTSQEGQKLTGYKLLIEGMLHQKIEYIAYEPTQSVHAAEFNVPFSSFIILPENFREGLTPNVKAYVEDVYVKLISRRCIFKNVTLRLEAEIIC